MPFCAVEESVDDGGVWRDGVLGVGEVDRLPAVPLRLWFVRYVGLVWWGVDRACEILAAAHLHRAVDLHRDLRFGDGRIAMQLVPALARLEYLPPVGCPAAHEAREPEDAFPAFAWGHFGVRVDVEVLTNVVIALSGFAFEVAVHVLR